MSPIVHMVAALEPISEGRSERKSRRSPLQTLYDGDPVSRFYIFTAGPHGAVV